MVSVLLIFLTPNSLSRKSPKYASYILLKITWDLVKDWAEVIHDFPYMIMINDFIMSVIFFYYYI